MQKVFRTTEREPPERWHTIPREKFPRSQSFNSSYIRSSGTFVNNHEVEHIYEHDKLPFLLSFTRDNYTCILFYTNKYIRSSKYLNHTDTNTTRNVDDNQQINTTFVSNCVTICDLHTHKKQNAFSLHMDVSQSQV